ncbi:MAG: hypothetical protein Q9195_005036 [Heterodermia aff. obscurata]
MSSRSAPQRTKDLTSYNITLDQIIQNHKQSHHFDKRGRLLKWSRSMSTLLEILHARRPSRQGITESDYADTLWSWFMCHIPETLSLLRSISQSDLRPPNPAFEEVLDRVQFHTGGTEIITGYYKRERAKSQPSTFVETSGLGRKYAQDSAALRARAMELFRLGDDNLFVASTAPAKDAEATIHMTSEDWPKLRDSVLNSVLQALLRGREQAAPGFPDADFGLFLRLAVSAFTKHTIEALKDYDDATIDPSQLDLAGSNECTLQDPLQQSQSGSSPSSQLASRSLSSLETTSSTLISRDRHEKHNEDLSSLSSQNYERIDQEMPRGAEVEVDWDSTIEMKVAHHDSRKSMADQNWLPARLRIFLDKSEGHRKYRLAVCRGNSLLTKHYSRNGPSLSQKKVRLTTKQFSQLQLVLCSIMHSTGNRQRFGSSSPMKAILCASLPRILVAEAFKTIADGPQDLTELQQNLLVDEYGAIIHFP